MISQFDMCRYPVLIRPTCNCCHNDGWTVTITNIILNNQNRPDSPLFRAYYRHQVCIIYISFFYRNTSPPSIYFGLRMFLLFMKSLYLYVILPSYANALFPAYADDLACQKFISSDSLSQLLLGCFFLPFQKYGFYLVRIQK